jgi:hypothetical protein
MNRARCLHAQFTTNSQKDAEDLERNACLSSTSVSFSSLAGVEDTDGCFSVRTPWMSGHELENDITATHPSKYFD